MTKQFKMSWWLVEMLQQDASEESESDEEIDFNNNLDVVYEPLQMMKTYFGVHIY